MADRKDNINEQQAEQQAEQKLREEIREEMKNADQTPAEEHYSLNDDRRVKVLSPGMLVAKRFIRNRMAVTGLVILIFMFVFSFIGGLVSPMGRISSSIPTKPSARASVRPRKTPSSATAATAMSCLGSPHRPRPCWPSSRARIPSISPIITIP